MAALLGVGSSPLARGLHPTVVDMALGVRIIPARAGFTQSGDGGVGAQQDHPRSRGVYAARQSSSRTASGSSPLARGLQRELSRQSGVKRIIPARAGFTSSGSSRPVWQSDHPRSRGVYSRSGLMTTYIEGSSPLARGLRGGFLFMAVASRIIPARAGFAFFLCAITLGKRDHPRSRGVYSRTSSRTSLRRGSSPLARGLPHPAQPRRLLGGIIPARAGFTRPSPPTWSPDGDHPRSRGVYRRGRWATPRRGGSSPLARGLRGGGVD